jgi:hypothetical protein
MAIITQIATLLRGTKAPNQPIAPVEYDQRFQDQFSNVLRLYFNTLDNFTNTLTSTAGGSNLRFPNGAFHQDGVTALTANISNVSTTPIAVTSTADFLSAGAILIGTELIQYTGKTPTTFTGITRGAYGSTKAAHTSGAAVSEAQPVPSPTTALTVVFTQTDVANQVAIDPTDKTKIVFDVAGYYNVQFSIQLLTFDSSIDNVTLWFRQNGVDVANSAGIVSVPAIHGGVPGAAIISWNLVLPLNAGDYVQLLMASDSGNTVAATYPAGTAPVHPASPSIILTATFVSALYA